MKKLIKKTFFLSVSVLAICILYVGIIIILGDTNTNYLEQMVYDAIDKSNTENTNDSLMLGDSVANNLWNVYEDSDDICHLATNQAITPYGNYFLLRNYLEHNKNVKKVYYIVTPQSLMNDMDKMLSYSYFIAPFCNEDNMKLIDPETQEKIYSKFGRIFVKNDLAKKIIASNSAALSMYIRYINRNYEDDSGNHISGSSVQALKKMDDLCSSCEVEFIVKAAPLSENVDRDMLQEFQKSIESSELQNLMGNYIDDIDYYPAEWFSDATHFRQEILLEYGDEIRNKVLDD